LRRRTLTPLIFPDWKRRIAFETLRPYTAIKHYLDGLKQLAIVTTGDGLRQVLIDYREFMQKVPLDALPFKVPTNTQQVFNEWIVNIAQQEIRMGVVPTFKKEWLDSFTQDIANQVQGHYPYYHMAVTQLVTEDKAGYAETCRRMLDRFLETNKPLEARFAAWTACLAPSSLSDYSPALDLYQRLHSGDAVGVELGALLYRAGEFSRARDELLRIAEIENPNSSPAYVWYFLAMVEMKLGNRDTATAWAKKADERLAEQQSAAAYSTTLWNRVATERLLQSETRMVLQGTNE